MCHQYLILRLKCNGNEIILYTFFFDLSVRMGRLQARSSGSTGADQGCRC